MWHRQDRQKEGARGRGARTANVSCCFRGEVEKRTVSTGATSTILRGEHTSAKKPDSCGTNTTTLQGENPSVPLEHSDGNRKRVVRLQVEGATNAPELEAGNVKAGPLLA